MAVTGKTDEPAQQSKLSLTPKELDKALKMSADRRKRLAAAFGLKVPGYKLVKTKKWKNSVFHYIFHSFLGNKYAGYSHFYL